MNERVRRLATGTLLKSIFKRLNPFDQDLKLRSEGERRTVLAANGNYPLELELTAFFKAASMEGGSPLIIQFSGAALGHLGEGLKEAGSPQVDDIRMGARMARYIAEVYSAIYPGGIVALGLDHFAVPDLSPSRQLSAPPAGRKGDEVDERLAAAVKAAVASGVREPEPQEVAFWAHYLRSQDYRDCLSGFMAVIEEMDPAWAMIDTGEVPRALNFAITKEVCDMVRAYGSDAMVEAEYGATGQEASHEVYEPLGGSELRSFAREVAGFVKYTGASGISYPIGMEHAAPSAVKHEPDVAKLEVVQREILKVVGEYVPFAQHGGTGAKEVARGLVGKDNVNTHFLVVAAQSLANHALEHRQAIEAGEKSSCGSNMYMAASQAILDAAVAKLKECGTYGIAKGLM